ncbi:MAG: class I SAM-dependent methyltransferase [Caldilineaceae bacterium]|nr:class I SAM-dependent methyltransferase [Caldilineaceae bacterium]
MDHKDHVNLLRRGVSGEAGIWADLGAGSGAFTLALAELVGPGSVIHAVDKDRKALNRLTSDMARRYPAISCCTWNMDFTKRLDLPRLDGIVMANSLHFLAEKQSTLQQLREYLKPNGRLLVVEYDTDRGNYWVPYPLSFATWVAVATAAGFGHTELLATHPSSFLGRFFAAASW